MSVRSKLDEEMGFQSLIRAHYRYDVEARYQTIRDYYCCPNQNESFKKEMINSRIIAPMLTFIRRTEGPVPHSRSKTINSLYPAQPSPRCGL